MLLRHQEIQNQWLIKLQACVDDQMKYYKDLSLNGQNRRDQFILKLEQRTASHPNDTILDEKNGSSLVIQKSNLITRINALITTLQNEFNMQKEMITLFGIHLGSGREKFKVRVKELLEEKLKNEGKTTIEIAGIILEYDKQESNTSTEIVERLKTLYDEFIKHKMSLLEKEIQRLKSAIQESSDILFKKDKSIILDCVTMIDAYCKSIQFTPKMIATVTEMKSKNKEIDQLFSETPPLNADVMLDISKIIEQLVIVSNNIFKQNSKFAFSFFNQKGLFSLMDMKNAKLPAAKQKQSGCNIQ